ncbi:hypothetical protein MQK_02749, partial [Staphylococcus aureus subsp. aureus VRS6]
VKDFEGNIIEKGSLITIQENTIEIYYLILDLMLITKPSKHCLNTMIHI